MSFENLEQQRKQSEAENEVRAEERNKNRTLRDKLTFKNKVTGLEMAEEEARKMGEEAEKLAQSEEASTLSEAIETLNTKEEFSLKGKERIEKEEYARAKALKVVEKLEAGDFEKAFHLLDSSSMMATRYDEETRRLIREYVAPLIRARAIEDLKNKNGDDFLKLLEQLGNRMGPYSLKAEDLKEIPPDVLKSPEIVAKVRDYLVESFKSEPHVFDRVLERYVGLGFVTKEEIVRLPQIEEAARTRLMRCPLQQEVYTDSPGSQLKKLFQEPTFNLLKKRFTELGILSEAEIEQIRAERAGK